MKQPRHEKITPKMRVHWYTVWCRSRSTPYLYSSVKQRYQVFRTFITSSKHNTVKIRTKFGWTKEELCTCFRKNLESFSSKLFLTQRDNSITLCAICPRISEMLCSSLRISWEQNCSEFLSITSYYESYPDKYYVRTVVQCLPCSTA